ncbi:MAG: filamentous hemagglutinin N-terminal domain-containing protein [Polaromonas sp.]|uniref:two-partner secretion domain-containing protein n=1 Tax=Polaromonas sp. TaxID=1869339 RepID=UPI002717D4CE|nr:filamentous hemagglutinin N-terminal domain-containing protein [Polaromonas sp.]MDO9113995.1 filamentous hemagglutinin N-terminal domain-containing protein [Polaromonas sp.]MDP1888840.1 filamentous hemagglutinin N-terminal domain-containing protein [Polaromonas sp.]
MNRIHQSIWSDSSGAFVAVSENAGGAGKKKSSSTTGRPSAASFAVKALSACLMLGLGASAYALPTGGVVAAGGASITSGASSTTITQSTANTVINWQSFGIAAGQTVQFVQPGSTSVALNRVLGADPSSIMGNLSANGRVFLLNPNGVLFGSGASVNVGGLVASTMSLSDARFMAGDYTFTDAGSGSVVNQGNITAADGGYVALMGKTVSNQGVISARLGSVALAAGNAVTMDVAGDGLLNVSVSQGAVNALVENRGMIQADGGRVLLTAQAAGNLLQTVVNNTGVIQAQTIGNRNGTILLLGDMQSGTMNVGGTLDASAPNGGNGGFIETSAANVRIRDDVRVTTAAPHGLTGTWLIDPQDFIIGAGGNISGATLSAQLVNNSINITTAPGPGNGDIFVNDSLTWTAAGAPTTLTLTADRDININAAITATNGNFVACCGRDINVNAALTTTNGSILLGAGRNLNQNAAITATDGNLMMCAANDVNINGMITVTNGTLDATRSLGLPRGLTISADTDGTGPGVAGGTVVFAPLAPLAAVTNAPVTITYNPVSYTTPTDYSTKFTLTTGATLAQRMLVFPEVTKNFDGTTTAILTSLKGAPAGVSLIAGSGATATFDNAIAGTNKTVTFTGYTLGGANASQFALASSCCGPIVQKTTGTIRPAIVAGTVRGGFVVNPDGSFDLPYIELAMPALATLASYRSGLMPTYMSDAGDVFFVTKEEEVVAPTVAPFAPPPPYVAPRYVPKPARN